MGTLYELIQSAHKTAKENADGMRVNFVHLNHPVEYRRDNGKKLEITAGFDDTSENLRRISVTLMDEKVSKTFDEKEIQSLTRFIDNPFFLDLTGSPHNSAFNLEMVDYGPVLIAKFKSETRGKRYGRVNYNELGKIFGLNFKGKDKILTLWPLGNIDSSRVPEAFEWTLDKGFSPSLYLSEKGKKALYLHGFADAPHILPINRFTLEEGIDYLDTKSMAMTSKQVDALEAEITGYRETNLAQMPFNMWRFSVVTNEPEVPNLKTAFEKGWSVGDKIFRLFQWGLKSRKSEDVYKDLPIESYR
jgi:hypothetical protein